MNRDTVVYIALCVAAIVIAVYPAPKPAPPPDLSLLPMPCASERHLPGNPFVIPCPCQ